MPSSTANNGQQPEAVSYTQTNVIIASYLLAYTAKTIFITSMNEIKVDSLTDKGEKVPFTYPFVQLCASYSGEFIFTIFYYTYKLV